MSHRRKSSGSADLRNYIFHDSRRLLGRKLEGDGKSRRFAGIAQPFLPIPPVEFYRHSVYPIIFFVFFLLPLFPIGDNLAYVLAKFVIFIYLETEFFQQL